MIIARFPSCDMSHLTPSSSNGSLSGAIRAVIYAHMIQRVGRWAGSLEIVLAIGLDELNLMDSMPLDSSSGYCFDAPDAVFACTLTNLAEDKHDTSSACFPFPSSSFEVPSTACGTRHLRRDMPEH